MAEEVMDKSNDVDALRNQMDHTRSSLACKLEALEEKVRSTVESTKSTVEDTVKAAKDSVQETIQTVKRTFDLKYQVAQHPWAMMGCAIFTGAVVAHLTAPRSPRREKHHGNGGGDEGYRHRQAGEFSEPVQQWRSAAQRPSIKSRILGQFEDEVCKLQSIAVGAGIGALRDWVNKSLPSLAPHLSQVFDSATQKLGGERIEGPVLRSSDDTETT
jgi:ElaB/YqjD/DUF883 family membrane-anchored ribosome-binding protein